MDEASKGNNDRICQSCQVTVPIRNITWQCRSRHTTCVACALEHTASGGVPTCQTQGCEEKFHIVKPQPVEGGCLYIFLDDSNIWIQAKKLAAAKLNLMTTEDPRVRIIIGKITELVAKGREVAGKTLYGSEPPPIDTVWKKIRENGWKVSVKKKSLITNKEKQVDQQLVVDVTKLVFDVSCPKGTIVIVSGDADMIPAITTGVENKWLFEIWTWNCSKSKELESMRQANPEKVRVFELDNCFDQVTLTNYKFRTERFTPSLKSLAAVILGRRFKQDSQWANKLSRELRWPFEYCQIVDKDDTMLVFPSAEESVFEEIFSALQAMYGEQVLVYAAYCQRFSAKPKLYTLPGSCHSTPNHSNQSSRRSSLNSENQQHFIGVVRNKVQSKKQLYSSICNYRSKCWKATDCKFYHPEAEKKFFKNKKKKFKCHNGRTCLRRPDCEFAHSSKQAFCCQCHAWGHFVEDCKIWEGI